MDFKQIQELIKLVNRTKISELKIQDKDFKIAIRSKSYTEAIQQKPDGSSGPAITLNAPPQAGAAPMVSEPVIAQEVAEASSETTASDEQADDSHLIAIKSPMIGTFYRSPSPDKDAFVKVGDHVSVGTVVCIIEAMKLFNDIESEVEGKIVKVLVDNATPVEYDQPLYLVEPV